MLRLENLAKLYGLKVVFKGVSCRFTAGSITLLAGGNGAGKSTLLRIIAGLSRPSAGEVIFDGTGAGGVAREDGPRLAYLGHATFVYPGLSALENLQFWARAHGLRPSRAELLALLEHVGLAAHAEERAGVFSRGMAQRLNLARVLLLDADLVLLDEPGTGLDVNSMALVRREMLAARERGACVIVVSHDRHFLNTVCTHIVDIDYGKIKMYVGNYDFWYESSQLIQQLIRNKNKRAEEKIAELQTFIARFAANKAKSKQATSRRRLLDKMSVEEMPASSRRYPFVGFEREREVGKDILFVTDVSKTIDGVKLLDKVSFIVNKNDKIAFVGENELAQTTLFKILMGELEPDEGSVKWGQTVTTSYLPKDNTEYFEGCTDSLVDWIRQFSSKKDDVYLRGFLGRMLFSGEEVFKPVNVLSGGEKVRCMLSRMMLSGANVLLLDQPTNHLDMEAIQAVNKGLCAFPGNILLASHDHELLQTTCNRVIEFQPDGTIIDRLSSYDDYVAWKLAKEGN